MITPSFGLTATERVLPKLALDFTTATLDPRVTFTRSGNTATYTNSSGVITAINADLPRFDYNPTTLICQGLLIEETRTNILLNSLINGTILSTQIVTTSATAYTLSFYGTGSIVLTGTHSATVTGTGVYPSRKTYTFTPTAGALTCTVTGSVQYAQLETGSFATSFIPTSVASVTRNADVATMTGTNFSSWYNQTEGTFVAQVDSASQRTGAFPAYFGVNDGTGNNAIGAYQAQTNGTTAEVLVSGSQTATFGATAYTNNTKIGIGLGYKLNNFGLSISGGNTLTDVSGAVPTVDRLQFGGHRTGNSIGTGHIYKFFYYPQKLTSNEIRAFSKL